MRVITDVMNTIDVVCLRQRRANNRMFLAIVSMGVPFARSLVAQSMTTTSCRPAWKALSPDSN